MNYSRPTFLMLVLSLFLVGGCAESADSVVKSSIACFEEAATALESITDEASAQAADNQLRAIVKKMEELNDKARALDVPNDEMAKIQMDNEAKSKAALNRVAAASRKAMEVPGGRDVVLRFNQKARGRLGGR